MRTELPNASYVGQMFIAYVRTHNISPAQVEDVLRAIRRGLWPSLDEGCTAERSLRKNIESERDAGPLLATKQPTTQGKELVRLRQKRADQRKSKWKPASGLDENTANGLNRDAPCSEPLKL